MPWRGWPSSAGYKPVIGYLRNHERAGRLWRGVEGVPIVAGDIAETSVRARLIEAARSAGELYGLAVLVGRSGACADREGVAWTICWHPRV